MVARHEQAPVRRGDPDRAEPRSFRYWFATIWTSFWGVLTFAVLGVAIPDWADADPDVQGAIFVILFTAAMTGAGVSMLRREQRGIPQPKYRRPALSSIPPARVRAEKRYRLPRPKSTARQPMRRLAEAESALAELLRQLGDSPVPAEVVDEAWRTATDAATRLRAVAAKLDAVELAAEQLQPPARAALDDGARKLRAYLEQGLDGYRSLIAAAGRVLLASTQTLASEELIEATEKLAGLAEALDELGD